MSVAGGTLSPGLLAKVRDLVYEKAGIDMQAGKDNLIHARLSKKATETGLSCEEYIRDVLADTTGESLIGLIDVLTTNFTSFLREPAHFDLLRDQVIPLIRDRQRIDIWCAAASTGEEPYTLAFVLLEALGLSAASRCRILSTDISTRVLTQAGRAIYPKDRFNTVPREWLSKYLLKGEGKYQNHYCIKPEVRRMVVFQRLNLIEPFQHAQQFPVISCRNVMIYFDNETRDRVVNRLSKFLEPGGYLFVGHSEGLTGVNHPFEFVRAATYKLPGTLS